MKLAVRRILRRGKALNNKYLGGYLLKNRFNLISQFNIRTIIDIGANSGQYAYYTRKLGYRHRIISFEPLKSAFDLMNKFARYDKNWETVNCAIGNIDGEIEINVSANSVCSSILDMMPYHLQNAPQSAFVGKEVVKIAKLDTLIENYIDNYETTFVKIDTQGFEKNILEGGERTFSRVKGLQMELSLVELYKGEFLFHEMLPYIIGKGYTLYSLEPGFFDKKTGRLLQVDTIFFRA